MAELLSYALCQVDDVKDTLGISGSGQDNLIKRQINRATQDIENWCKLAYNHHFKEQTYSNEEYDGTGVDQISLKMRPVSAVSSFQYRSGVFSSDSWDDVDNDYYFLDGGAGVIDLLISQNRNWNAYRVTYTAGYSTIPAALAEACVTLACYYLNNVGSGAGVKRKREGGREIEYFDVNSNSNQSLIESLGLDEALANYVNYAVQDDK